MFLIIQDILGYLSGFLLMYGDILWNQFKMFSLKIAVVLTSFYLATSLYEKDWIVHKTKYSKHRKQHCL